MNFILDSVEQLRLHLYHHFSSWTSATNDKTAFNALLAQDPVYSGHSADSWLYFLVNNTSIIAMSDSGEGGACKIIMRNPCGKFNWECMSVEPVEPQDLHAICNSSSKSVLIRDESTSEMVNDTGNAKETSLEIRGGDDEIITFLKTLSKKHEDCVFNFVSNASRDVLQKSAEILDSVSVVGTKDTLVSKPGISTSNNTHFNVSLSPF